MEEAFANSKMLLPSYPVLVPFDPKCKVLLACDASPYGIGVVLSCRMPDSTERPVGFISQTLSIYDRAEVFPDRKRGTGMCIQCREVSYLLTRVTLHLVYR